MRQSGGVIQEVQLSRYQPARTTRLVLFNKHYHSLGAWARPDASTTSDHQRVDGHDLLQARGAARSALSVLRSRYRVEFGQIRLGLPIQASTDVSGLAGSCSTTSSRPDGQVDL